MVETPVGLERAVARFVTRYDWDDVGPATLDAAKALMKDQFAIQIGASQLPWSRRVRAFRDPRPGPARIVGETGRAAAADAAYLNATYGHGFEYDDFFGNAHPGCCVVPTAFAIAEEVGASLRDTVVAMITGYETYVRIGALGSPAFVNAGWQPHAVLANFGAAATAAKLYDLTEDETFHALAIALSHAGGTTEYASTGGSVKRVHAGIAVRNGIEAAQLARAGITGPRGFLTGNRGLYRMFADTEVTDDADEYFAPESPNLLPGASFKPYCCCALTFCYIEAMERFRERADRIDRVVARIQTVTDSVVGTKNSKLYNPSNIEELQYSLPTQMALAALGRGNGYTTHRAFLEGRLDLSPDSDVMRFARRIELEVANDLDAYQYFVADVTVYFDDGTHVRHFQERSKGAPNNPFSENEFQAKLSELTQDVIGRDRAERLFGLVDDLDPRTPVSDLTGLLQLPS